MDWGLIGSGFKGKDINDINNNATAIAGWMDGWMRGCRFISGDTVQRVSNQANKHHSDTNQKVKQ